MVSRTALGAVVALSLALAPLAVRAQTSTLSVSIIRTAGSCPGSITVSVVTKQYPGGFTMDYTAKTAAAANAVKVTASTPQRIAFTGSLLPAYRSCQGVGKSNENAFTLHGGTLSYVISPGKGPNGTYPGALRVNVVKGLPHANVSITD